MFKPFRPPLLKRRPDDAEPPQKKARLSSESDQPTLPSFSGNQSRRPLLTVANPAGSQKIESAAESKGLDSYYTVLWRKPSAKKHKTWDGDGVLSVVNGYACLKDVSGKDMGRAAFKLPLLPGSTLSVGGKEVEVDSVLSRADYLAGKPFLSGAPPKIKNPEPASFKVEKSLLNSAKEKQQLREEHAISKPIVSLSKASTTQFKNPFANKPKPAATVPQKDPIARHDPKAPGALVMARPTSVPRGKQIVDVVVDPLLSRHLRPHQIEGVKFIYECVMGFRSNEGQGAILADHMGLGKTLQTIALIWTLLKQNPIHGADPVAKKVLIVCPKTLENNWRKEFRKWLGRDRLGVFIAEDKKNRITDFTLGRAYSVMIVGYEKLRTVQEHLKKGSGIDLVIADEGHRLKTAQNKASLAIKGLGTDRIVLLSGTILQNDLTEFYYGVDLVNPGSLGKLNTFKKEFSTPILRGRQPEANEDDREKGEARLQELMDVCSQFVLRRTADVIAQFLPPRTETVVYCRPTSVQAAVYRSVLESPIYGALIGSSEASLQLINVLKKLCNGPSLLFNASSEETESEKINSLITSIEAPNAASSPGASAKLQLLDQLLHQIRETTDEKIVVVSNYTTTLDMIQRLLSSLDYTFMRLDGTTPAAKRQGLVDKFNKQPVAKSFVFLLSAKAGGVGINLIGASRLVLFDVDWNPATDLQAMARIHRDGQKRPCYIYRFVLQGTLEEKIYQRQVTKTGLSDAVVDSKKTAQGFTTAELRDLFRLVETETCPTHDLLGCDCDGRGNTQVLPESSAGTDVVTATPGWGRTMDDPAADEESDDDYQDIDEIPAQGVLINASKINMEEQEAKLKKTSKRGKKEESMLALMQYLHIDASKVRKGDEDLEALIEDQVLLEVLKEKYSHVSFLFARTTG